MTRLAPDQAEGLRRLFVSDVRRMTALVTAEARDALLAARLAEVLTAQGLRVLLVDEHLTAGRKHEHSGVTPRHDFDSVLHGEAVIERAIVETGDGIHLLAGGGNSRPLTPVPVTSRIELINAFYRLAGRYDAVLVTTPGGQLQGRPSFAWACQDVVLHCADSPDSVTRAYALIKLLQQTGERRFHLLFAGMEEAVAGNIFRRIASVCRRYLHVMPASLGVVPQQQDTFLHHLADQIQTWPLPDQQSGHFPVLMRRLLSGGSTRVIPL